MHHNPFGLTNLFYEAEAKRSPRGTSERRGGFCKLFFIVGTRSYPPLQFFLRLFPYQHGNYSNHYG